MANHPDGMLAARLPQLYFERFGVKLPYKDLGFDNMKNFLRETCRDFLEVAAGEKAAWIKPIRKKAGKSPVRLSH